MENYAQRRYKKKKKMPVFHNVWAFLLQLLKVICESTLLALCPSSFFAQTWPCKPQCWKTGGSVSWFICTHRSSSSTRNACALIKRFAGEFKAYAAWKLMTTSRAAKQNTEEAWWAIYGGFTHNLQFGVCVHHCVSTTYSIIVMRSCEWVES